MIRSKKIAIIAIVIMLLTLIPGALLAATADSTRLSGDNRIETALAISSAGWTTAGTVVLAPANDANLVDALAAAPLAGQENAPILLTNAASLDAAVKARIAALGATKVFVVGAISEAVAAEVDAISGVAVEVLKGANRQATAAAVNAKLTAPAGTFVVGFNAVPDALSVASFAAKNKYAIVLANADGSVGSTLVGATKYIIGGPTLVADIAGVERIFGADRFATNAAVAAKLGFSFDRVYVANGISLVDALSVAPLAAKYGAFVALASGNDVAAAGVVNAKLSASSKVIAVGGTAVVSAGVVGKVGFVTAADLVVESVSAINGKQLVVKFSKAVDKSSVIDNDLPVAGLIEVSRIPADAGDKDVVANDAYANLSSDGKTLTLVPADVYYFDGTYSLHIADGIISKDAKDDLGKYTTTFSISDKTAPTVVGVKYNSATDKIDVTMSEPVDVEPTVTVNNGSPRSLTPNSMGTRLSFDNAWTKGTTVTVRVSGAVDYKENEQASTFTQSVNIDMDETPLGVTSVTQDKSNVIKVVFNKAIFGDNDPDRATNVSGGVAVYRGGIEFIPVVSVDDNDSSKTTYLLTLDDDNGPDYAFYPTNQNSTTVNVVFIEDAISDVFGNTNNEITRNVAMSKDTAGPVIVSAKLAASEEDFVVRFNEDIDDIDLALVTVRVDGVDISGEFGVTAEGKALTLAYDGGEIPNGTYTVRVGKDAIQDTHGNENATQSANITITGSASPVEVLDISAIVGADNEFEVVFGGKVGVSATAPASYTLNGVALPSSTDIYFTGPEKDTVIIKLDDNSVNYSANVNLRVLRVYDTDGNKLDAFTGIVPVVDNIKPTLLSANLSGNVLTLNFDEDMNAAGFNGTSQALADLLVDIEIKGGTLALTAGDGSAFVSVDGKKVILAITAGTSNWNTVKAYSVIRVKTLEDSELIVDKDGGLSIKKDVTVTVAK